MSREADAAAGLLARFGEPVLIEFPGVAGFDPITGGAITAEVGISYIANAYPGRYTQGELADTAIKATDIRLILELLPQRPVVGCLAVVQGVAHRVMDLQAIRKAGADVLYICQLRKN